jgi:hypothetical protein
MVALKTFSIFLFLFETILISADRTSFIVELFKYSQQLVLQAQISFFVAKTQQPVQQCLQNL